MHWFQSFFVMTWWGKGTSFPLYLVSAAKKNRIHKLKIHRHKTITKHTSHFFKTVLWSFIYYVHRELICVFHMFIFSSAAVLIEIKARKLKQSFTTDSRLLPPHCSFHPTGCLLSFQPSLHQHSMRLCLASAQTSAPSSSFSCALSSSYSPAERQNT